MSPRLRLLGELRRAERALDRAIARYRDQLQEGVLVDVVQGAADSAGFVLLELQSRHMLTLDAGAARDVAARALPWR